MTKNIILVLVFFQCSSWIISQNNQIVDDSKYYQNWVGKWHKVNQDSIEVLPSFMVKYGLYQESFEETWIEPGGYFSQAWRAWDKRTNKWDFAWMSSDGYFQIWEGRKLDGIWYIYNSFSLENGQNVMSRQAFIMESKTTMIRTSEHSKDNGETWTLRFKEMYIKKK